MRLVELSNVFVGPRQRKKMDRGKLDDLKHSILDKGLMHPIVASTDTLHTRWELVAGERRLTAIREFAEADITFRCDGQWVLPGMIPVTNLADLTPEQLFGAELEENLLREELSWQDRVAAIARLHEMRKETAPPRTSQTEQDPQSVVATAREMHEKAPHIPVRTLRKEIADALIVAKHLDSPAISRARSASEAKELALKAEHEMYQAQLIRKKAARAVDVQAEVQCGDLHDLMPKLDGDKYDLILTDPPYGSKADSDNYRSRTVHHHNYDDTPENARKILRTILTEGWRVTKPKANIFIFTDIRHWEFLQQLAGQMGWSPWRLPIIWRKSQSEGMAGWGSKGFVHTYDIIFWATKGQRGLMRTEVDVIDEARVKRSLRTHAAEKPVALLELLIDLTTLPGDWVLDPCLGSGSTLVAARRLKRHGLGIELSQDYADSATVRIDEAAEGESFVEPEKTDEFGLPD